MGLPEQSLGTRVNFPCWTNEGPSGPAGISPLRASLYPSWQDFSHAGCLHGVTGKIPLLSNISKIISLDRLPIPSIKIFLEDKVLLLQHITPRAGENFATHFWNLALSGFPPTYLSNNPSKREEASYFPLAASMFHWQVASVAYSISFNPISTLQYRWKLFFSWCIRKQTRKT